MSRRETVRREYRRALVPGLLLSVAAHVLLLGLGAVGVPPWEETEPAPDERTTERSEQVMEVVDVRPAPARTPARSVEASRPDTDDPAEAGLREAAAPSVRTPSSTALHAEPVPVPAPAAVIPVERRREDRLSATDLAALFPGDGDVPRPTSRAAREASGDGRRAGDGFRAPDDTRRVAPRRGGCIVRPGGVINRRLPRGIVIGG